MWESLKNFGNKIKEKYDFWTNKLEPTYNAAKALVSNIWSSVKSVWFTGAHTYGAGESAVFLVGNVNKTLFKASKGLLWDLPHAGFALNESVDASKKVLDEAGKDFSSAYEHAGLAYQNAASLIDNTKDALYYTGATVCHSTLAGFHALETLYEAGKLTVEGISSGVEMANLYLPSFTAKKANSPMLMLQAPGLELQKEAIQFPSALNVAAASMA